MPLSSSGQPRLSSTPAAETPGSAASTPPSTEGEATKRQKLGRRSRPKVKTGCANCKQRRIKCDEARPACTQCVRSHKECSGYPPPSRYAIAYPELRMAPASAIAVGPAPSLPHIGKAGPVRGPSMITTNTILPPRRGKHRRQLQSQLQQIREARPNLLATSPLTFYRPLAGIALGDSDAHYFDLFRIHTAPELSGYHESEFWTRHVLQSCHSQPAICHAAVALGALYRTLEQSTKSPPHLVSRTPTSGLESGSGDIMSHWQVAVRQYSQACNAIMNLDGQARHSNHTRLMANVLLSCFDAFIGDHKQAIIQLQNGLGLLERLKSELLTASGDHLGSVSAEPIEEELVNTFIRLAIQGKSYDLAFHFPEPFVIHLNSDEPETPPLNEGPCPESKSFFCSVPPLDRPFANMYEARLAYEFICEKSLRFVERLHFLGKQPYPLFPSSWRQYSLSFQSDFDAWARAFQHLLEARLDPSSLLNSRERSAIATLKMFQVNSEILLYGMFSSSESHFDALVPKFRTIVQLGYEVVARDERRALAEGCLRPEPCTCHHCSPGKVPGLGPEGITSIPLSYIRPSFSADLGIVPPLFVVSTKCRDPILRRQAIHLLRSSARRESMWDSELAARIGQWVMELEESAGSSGELHYQQQPEAKGSSRMGIREDPGAASLPVQPIPEERRVMIHSVDFDLRSRFANLQVGARGASRGQDDRNKSTRLTW